MLRLEVVHSLDDQGHEIVTLPLKNSKQSVKLYAEDFDELLSLGISLPWILRQGSVVYNQKQKPLNIGRILMDAGDGEAVSWLDQNPCNLCKSNLIRVKGNGRNRTRNLIEKCYKPAKAEVIHIRT